MARLGRPAELVEDVTPFDGPRVDVKRRIGWLLRVNRIASGDPDCQSLARFANRLEAMGIRADAPLLSAWEHGRSPVPRSVMAGYAHLLGLPSGQLRAATDGLLATFGPRCGGVKPGSLGGAPRQYILDKTYDAVADATARGGDWLGLSELLTTEDGMLLPSRVVEPLVQRLLSETMRAVGMAYGTRLGALARLAAHPHWGTVVTGQARALIHESGAHGVVNPLALLRNNVETRRVHWLVRLTGRIGRVEPATRSMLPKGVLAPFMACAQERLPQVQDRMFERLVKEALCSSHVERRHHANLLLLASPYRSAVASAATAAVDRCTSERLRQSTVGVLSYVSGPSKEERLARLLVDTRPEVQRTALISLAYGAGVDPGVDLAKLVDSRPALTGAAVCAAGMSGHPALQRWASNGHASPSLRKAARWWLTTGTAVTDGLAA